MLEVQSLVKRYGSRVAVDDLSFQVQPGETYGLLGPNGAGKSTLVSLIMGLLRPDSGQIKVCGGNPSDANIKAKVGIAPQALSLYEELSAQENLEFFGKLYRLTGTTLKSRIQEALDLAELSERRQDQVAKFSGGMKRRLNIAVAMLHHPQLLLLDEPTVGVDPQSRNHILECIQRLAARGMTVIYTTHYMEEAERLCDRIAIMDQGKMLATGTLDDLLQQFGGDAQVEVQIVGQARWPEDWHATLTPAGRWRFVSSEPLLAVSRFRELGVEVKSLSIEKPGLEAVFLNLTGRTLRDA